MSGTTRRVCVLCTQQVPLESIQTSASLLLRHHSARETGRRGMLVAITRLEELTVRIASSLSSQTISMTNSMATLSFHHELSFTHELSLIIHRTSKSGQRIAKVAEHALNTCDEHMVPTV